MAVGEVGDTDDEELEGKQIMLHQERVRISSPSVSNYMLHLIIFSRLVSAVSHVGSALKRWC